LCFKTEFAHSHSGGWLIYIFSKFFMIFRKKHKKIDFLTGHHSVDSLVEALHLHQKKKQHNGLSVLGKIFKYISLVLLIFIVLALILAVVTFFHFRGFYELALSGKNNLQNSLVAAQNKNFSAMSGDASAAQNSFTKLVEQLSTLQNNPVFKSLNLGQKELADINRLAGSASTVSKALNEAAVLGNQWNNIMGGKFGTDFSNFSSEQKRALLKSLHESAPEINGLKADLDLASLNLDNVEADGFLSLVKTQIKEAKDKLAQASALLSEATVVSQLAPEFFGYPSRSTFLVLFENSDELRPTGGFLGTYGILQTENGDIVRFDSHDIYHMDQPISSGKLLSIMPPDPIKKYLNKTWYMRDSNWLPDWPSAARQIVWFYNKENALLPAKNQINNFSGEFNGVIAVTPDFITSLLELTGPITVNGEEFTEDNFIQLLQYKVEQDYASDNVTSWQRKEIIGKILEQMKDKLFDLNYSQWPAVLGKITTAVQKKNILVYSTNDYQEGLIKGLSAGGEIKQTDSDYLLLVDANFASLKTDAVMKRNVEYRVRQKSDGLYSNLKITYTNTGKADWRTSDYKDYARIYLPEGSRLINASGFTVLDKTYNESGKTVVPGLISVKLGNSTTISLSYELPASLAEQFSIGEYSLYWQKQSGNKVDSVKVDVTAPTAIKSYNPLENVKINGNNIIWSSDLETDKEFFSKF
jgi:hypothetical protein